MKRKKEKEKHTCKEGRTEIFEKNNKKVDMLKKNLASGKMQKKIIMILSVSLGKGRQKQTKNSVGKKRKRD